MTLLKLQNPMMSGPNVKRLQELGDLLGYDTGANDGVYGPQTVKAVRMIQAKLGVVVDGICGPITWRALLDYVDKLAADGKPAKYGIDVYDIRGKHKRPKLYSHQRPWSEIDGVLFHQCGWQMPQEPGGWSRLNAHDGFTQEGKYIRVNKYTDMIWHGNGLSQSTIGLEFSGNFCGVRGDRKTLWKPGGGPDNLNLAMKMAADEAFEIIRDDFKAHNQPWTVIKAHRQASANRRADPGSEIWQGIAMAWAQRLGLKNYDGGPTWCKPKGLVIPSRWNPEYGGRY